MSRRWANSNRQRWRFLLPPLIGLLGVLLLLVPSRLGETLARSSYDWLHQLTGLNYRALADSPVLLVYLDRATFESLGWTEEKPLPREIHSRLLDRLTRAGARAVVFDILFTAPGPDPSADVTLAAALRRHGKVVLGARASGSTSEVPDVERPRLVQLESPLDLFATNAAAVGLASTAIDDDLVSRRHFAGLPSLDRRSLAYATADLVGKAARIDPESGRWIRYYGPPYALPQVSLHRALSDTDVADELFRDRIIFVGARPSPGQFNERADELRNPYVALTAPDRFMPGVEVHATQTMNLLRGDWLRRAGRLSEAIAWMVFGIVITNLLLRLRPAYGIPAALALAAVVALSATIAMSRGNLWFAWLIPVFIQTPIAIAGGLTFHSIDWFITRRRNEARIREQAELIDKAQDAILLFDLEGKLQLANPRARTLFELSPTGGTPIDFTLEPAVAARGFVLETGQWQGEMKRGRSGSTDLVLASRWTLIRDAHGTPTGILVIDTDVTEQKQLEAQLIRAQRLEAIGSIAGGMAHDLNNSLAPLLMGVQLLKRSHGDEPTRRTLDHMEASARRGAEMVRQVLSFARGRGSELTQLDAGTLVGEMTRLARETFPKNIRPEFHLARDLWTIEGNATQLHQVLLNLCVNARDAMPDGGTLTLAADNVSLNAVAAAAIPNARPGEFVSLLVNDTGTGMSPEHRARLFEVFFTTKPEGKGTGLGLPTVKRIVEAHAGFLNVTSTPGEGTTFEIFLPKAISATAKEVATDDASLPRGAGQAILFLTEHTAARELVNEALTHHGYRVLPTGASSEALEKVARGAWRPHLLVLDVDLPGIESRELLAAFRQSIEPLPAILIGAGPADARPEPPPLTKFLARPMEPQVLLRLVGQLLREAG